MTKESSHKEILQLMKTVDEKGLFQINSEYVEKEFLENFQKFVKAFTNTYVELGKKATSFETEEDDVLIFFIYAEVSFVITHLELVKKLLKYLVNPSLLQNGFDEETTLGQMVHRICKKLGFSGKSWDSTFALFHVDFRNAIAHQHYLISKDGIVLYPNKKNQRSYSIKELQEDASDVQGILEGLKEFVTLKTAEIDAEADKNERKTKELLKQKEELDRKLRELS